MNPADIVAAAVALHEDVGAAGFSVRKVAASVRCDPMAVLYHFGSRENLERAMADHLNAQLHIPDPRSPWRERLNDLALQYRELALRYPVTFPLLLRFWITGPADQRLAESVYQALTDAHLSDVDAADICCGWYAAILGLAGSEAGGMLRPGTDDELAEMARLPEDHYPRSRALLPVLATQQPGAVYSRTLELLLDGIEQRAQR